MSLSTPERARLKVGESALSDIEQTTSFPAYVRQGRDMRLEFLLHWCPRLGALCVLTLGLMNLLSWIVPGAAPSAEQLSAWHNNVPSGLAFVFCGLSLLLLQKTNPWLRDTGKIFALIVALTGLLGLLGHLLKAIDGTASLYWFAPVIERFSQASMAPPAAFNFFLVGMCLLALDTYVLRRSPLVEWTCGAISILCLLSLVIQPFSLPAGQTIVFWLTMDPLTALAGLVMAGSCLAVRTDSPLVAYVFEDSGSGTALRYLLPFLFSIPLLFAFGGGLASSLYKGDIFFRAVLPLAATLAILAGVCWRVARALRKREEQSSARLRALLKYVGEINELYNNAFCGFQSVDAAGTIVEMNDTELEWLGYTREEAVGKLKAEDIMTEQSLKNFQKLFPLFLELGWVRNIEFEMIRKDGSLMNALVSSAAVKDERGQLSVARSIVFDISEQKKKEQDLKLNQEHLRLLVENVQDYAIFALDRAGRVMTWNKGAEQICLYKKEEILGKSFASFYPAEEIVKGVTDKALQAALSAGRFEQETFLERADGTKFSSHIVITAARDDSDNLIGFIEIIRDLSEHDETHAEINRLNASLQKRVQDLSAAYEELKHLTDKFLYARQQDKEGQAAVSMPPPAVESLLEISKFDLLALVEDSAELFAQRARRKRLSVLTFVSPDNARLLKGDAGKIRLLLYNLIDNAVKFTSTGEVIVRAVVDVAESGNATLRLTVTDTGPGLDADDCRRLFAADQASAPVKPRSYFSGMGLSACREIVQELGGDMGVESSKGRGSVFWVSMPAEVSSEAADFGARDRHIPDTRILVVSSSDNLNEIIASYANLDSIRCDRALSGRKALAAMRQAAACGVPYQLVLVGPGLPDMSAASFAEGVSYFKDLKQTSLLLLSTQETESPPDRVRQSGYLDQLLLPVRREKLFESFAHIPEAPEDKTMAGITTREQKESATVFQLESEKQCRLLVLTSSQVEARLFSFLTRKLDIATEIISNAHEAASKMAQADYSLVFLDCDSPVIGGLEAITYVRRAEGFRQQHIPVIGMARSVTDEQRQKYAAAGLDDWMSKPTTMKRLEAVFQRWTRHKFEATTAQSLHATSSLTRQGTHNLREDIPSELRRLRQIYDPETVHDVVDFFLSSTASLLKEMEDSIKSHDARNLGTVAHQFTELCACIHFSDLSELSCAMEQEAKTQSWFQAELVWQALSACFHRTEGMVKQALS